MIKKVIALISLVTVTSAFAHSDHDWREDYQAYLEVNYLLPLFQGKSLRSSPAPSRIDVSFLKEKLKIFSGAAPYRSDVISDRRSDENLRLARAFLAEEYAKLGFDVSFHGFGGGINIIAEKKGLITPEKVLILSSHIDSVKTSGANDDGTGTIGLLALAKELSKNNYASTIRILGFDKEESGLHGSDAYVTMIKNKKEIIGNINFEMMGYNSRKDGAFHAIDCNKKHSLFLTDTVQRSINRLGLNLHIVKTCTRRSDHASFWRADIPAIVISENFFGGDGDPCYHSKCDVMDERLDFDYMSRILEAALSATEEIIKIH